MSKLIQILLILIIISCNSDNSNNKFLNKLDENNFMIKLYKEINGELHYWETWNLDEKSAIIHWGKVGEKGENETIHSSLFASLKSIIQKKINEKIRQGFAEIDENNLSFLEIEYKIEGFGSEEDLNKRHRLEERMDQTLGWTGLGHTDGGSIGSGTMEVGCVVVDFEIAKKVIEKDLKGKEFDDYSRIFKFVQ